YTTHLNGNLPSLQFLLVPSLPTLTLFPYTTLFRSRVPELARRIEDAGHRRGPKALRIVEGVGNRGRGDASLPRDIMDGDPAHAFPQRSRETFHERFHTGVFRSSARLSRVWTLRSQRSDQ